MFPILLRYQTKIKGVLSNILQIFTQKPYTSIGNTPEKVSILLRQADSDKKISFRVFVNAEGYSVNQAGFV